MILRHFGVSLSRVIRSFSDGFFRPGNPWQTGTGRKKLTGGRSNWTKREPETTPPKFNIAPENQWLEDVFPIEIVPF